MPRRTPLLQVLLASLAALLSFAGAAYAQASSAQLTGVIADATGAVVPGVTVTAFNDQTGLQRQTASNERGNYLIAPLAPGVYRVTVEMDGFKSISQFPVALAVDQTARLDFVLEVGATTESIEVTAAGALVDAETSALGQVIDSSKVLNLPLNGRSPFRLIQLTTNVAVAPTGNGQFQDIPVNLMDDSMVSINGGRMRSNEVLVDGIPTTTGFVNVMTTIPNVDSTQEFKVQSSNLSAEWGRFGGGVINVSTRSGTNELHGTMYEFLRNSALDANEFFNRRAGRDKPAFRMNQFGYALGGPIYLPKLYDGRNRTFFFTDYQGSRWRRGAVFQTTVPTGLQRQGDFSATRAQNGQAIELYDPLTTRANPQQAGRFLRDPFPGARLPASRLDPVAVNMAAFYPAGNVPGDPFTENNNYISNAGTRID